MEGHVQVEAHGFGIRLRTAVLPGETPHAAADRLVLAEDRRRRALHHAWLRGQELSRSPEPCSTSRSDQEDSKLVSLVVVEESAHRVAA